MKHKVVFLIFWIFFIFFLIKCNGKDKTTKNNIGSVEFKKKLNEIDSSEYKQYQKEVRDSIDSERMLYNSIKYEDYMYKHSKSLNIISTLYDMPSLKRSPNWTDNENRFNPTTGSVHNPMPDSILIKTSIMQNFMYLSYPQDFTMTLKLQLKFGLNSHCLYVSSPKLSKEYSLIVDKMIKDELFFKGNITYTKTGKVDTRMTKYLGEDIYIESIFPIREAVKNFEKEYGEYFFLNQIILNAYITPKIQRHGGVYRIEYIHPICSDSTDYR